jgi:hypothetical protein
VDRGQPANGEVYITMTENPDRGNTGTSSNNNPNPPLDAANPRYWLDKKGERQPEGQRQRPHRALRETGSDASARPSTGTSSCSGRRPRPMPASTTSTTRPTSTCRPSDFNDLSKPDGCWFSPLPRASSDRDRRQHVTDVTNCMLLVRPSPARWRRRGRHRGEQGRRQPERAVTTDVSVATGWAAR